MATLLGTILIRRTMTDKLMGRPILELPKSQDGLKHIRFPKYERFLYRLVEGRYRAGVNRDYAEGNASKKSSLYITQILRLRQMTNHLYLIEEEFKKLFTTDDMNEIKNQWTTLYGRNNEPVYKQLHRLLEDDAADGEDNFYEASFGSGSYGMHFKMDAFLTQLSDDELLGRSICPLCDKIPVNPRITSCDHIFCRDCIEKDLVEQMSIRDKITITCPKCMVAITGYKPYLAHRPHGNHDDDDFISDDSANSRRQSEKRKATPKKRRRINSPGSDHFGYEPKVKSTWLSLVDNNPDFELFPSIKMVVLKSELLKISKRHPKDKVIIFTQWTLSQRIVARICKQEGFGFVYFTGEMNQDQRTDAIDAFKKNKKVKIMIAGLKCGGVGLNLTCSNRVISLDLWWNHAVEQQAFGRVFRMGQDKETHFVRLVVSNTIDQRLLSSKFLLFPTSPSWLPYLNTGSIIKSLLIL